MKIVKLSEAEVTLLQEMLGHYVTNRLGPASEEPTMRAILSKLDSAVVEDHRDVPPEKASESGCMSEP